MNARMLGVLLAIAAACRAPGSDDPIPTMEIEPSAAFVRNVRAEGVLQAVEATPVLAPNTRGALKIEWLAPDGTRMEAGQVVMRFDPSDMERRLADSLDDVTAEERQIGKVSVESSATKRRRDAVADFAEFEASVARGLETHDANILSRVEILEEAIDLELAEARSAHARGVKKIERSVATNQVELHRIQREHHTREVEHAQEGLSKLQIVAPKAGILVLARNWRGDPMRVGDTVWSGMKVAELPLVDALQAEVHVLEVDAGNVVAGLPAEVVIEAKPSITWKAKVARIDTLAQPRHPEVPVHYFGVTLALDETDPDDMRVGQRVRATIRVEQPDAIVVPRHAVFERDGKTIVYREGAEGFEAVEVTVGPASAGRVVIESGVQAGDRIALRDPEAPEREVESESDGHKSAGGPP